MATIYRRGGKKNRNGTYYIQYFDENGNRRTVKGCTDKDATEALARKLEAEVMLKKRGVIDARAERIADESRRPIKEHWEDFEQDLNARDVTESYTQGVLFCLKRIFELAGTRYLGDITLARIQEAIGRIKAEGRTPKTANEYIASIKQFCRWASKDGRLAESPVAHLKTFNADVGRKHVRRAFTDDELRRLFEAATNGPTLQKCSGAERSLIYKVCALTGLRKNEIASLKKRSFRLDADPHTVSVAAAFSKHRREDTLPVPRELVSDLRSHLEGKSDNDLAFQVPKYAYRALKRDLAAAGIPYETADGFGDFHALRHTFVTRLVKSGVNTKTAQILARHSDPRLTLGVYSHIELIDQFAAVNGLPPLDTPSTETESERAAATGTDGRMATETATKTSCTYVGTQQALGGDSGQRKARTTSDENTPKPHNVVGLDVLCQRKASSGKRGGKVELTGIEPVTSGLQSRRSPS